METVSSKIKEEKVLELKLLVRFITMQDKTSTDFVVGTALGIDRYHPDYLPLYLATHTLGGNFSARLMQTVRVKEAPTYGINSSLSGLETATTDIGWLEVLFHQNFSKEKLNT